MIEDTIKKNEAEENKWHVYELCKRDIEWWEKRYEHWLSPNDYHKHIDYITEKLNI